MNPARESIKAMMAWGWTLDQDQSRFSTNRDSVKRRASKANVVTTGDGEVQDYLFSQSACGVKHASQSARY